MDIQNMELMQKDSYGPLVEQQTGWSIYNMMVLNMAQHMKEGIEHGGKIHNIRR